MTHWKVAALFFCAASSTVRGSVLAFSVRTRRQGKLFQRQIIPHCPAEWGLSRTYPANFPSGPKL